MKTKFIWILASVPAIWAGNWALPSGEPTLKPGTQSALVSAHCLVCHSADYISTQPPMSRTAWETIVVKMREKYGAPIPPDKIKEVVDYLAASYGTP